MSYRLSSNGIKAVLITYLDKNPRLEELIQIALENKYVDLPSILSRYNSRIEYAKLVSVKTVEEVDVVLNELTKNELEYISSLLPTQYVDFFRSFLVIYDLDRIYSEFLRGSLEKIATVFSRCEDLQIFRRCLANKNYSCLLEIWLENIKSSLERNLVKKYGFVEDYRNVFRCLNLFTIAKYVKYIVNVRELGFSIPLNPVEFSEKLIHILGIGTWYKYELENAINILENRFKSEPCRASIHEVHYVYSRCRDLLLYSPQVIDILTLYLLNRYYGIYVLRYVLPQVWVMR